VFTIAGGILLAIFILLVLVGLVVVLRDGFRFIFRFARANYALCCVLAGLLAIGLYVQWARAGHEEVVVNGANPGVKCTGQCVYR